MWWRDVARLIRPKGALFFVYMDDPLGPDFQEVGYEDLTDESLFLACKFSPVNYHLYAYYIILYLYIPYNIVHIINCFIDDSPY